jgi:uncharacterized membrane protein
VTAPAPVDAVDATAENSTPVHHDRGVPVGTPSAVWILIAGVVGLALSADLTIEKITMLGNTDYRPTCSINPILSCGSVMRTWQASVFGFPNPLLGIGAFTVILVTAVLAIGKVQLPRWYWVGAMIGTGLGVVMIHWLIFQTLYRIGALCPYCMVVWSVTIPLFVVVTSIALQPASGGVVARTIHTWRWSIVALWFTTVVLLILIRFWDYWSTLI